MASKFLFLYMLLSLCTLAVRLEGRGVLPAIRFINAVKGENPVPINLQVKAGGMLASAKLNSGESYRIRVKVDDVYFVTAVFGLRFTGFPAYDPARDKGHGVVYWRADNGGFAISHDNIHWKLVARWESE